MKTTLLIVFLLGMTFTSLKAQPLHTPIYFNDISLVGTPILKIKSLDSTIRSATITSEEFIINYENGSFENFNFDNKIIADLCNAVNYKLANKILLTSDYPDLEVEYLENQVLLLPKDSLKEVIYERSQAVVNIDFGGLFSIANKESLLADENLLSQAGFNLDLTIFKRYNLHKNLDLSLTPRLGLASNINSLSIDTTDSDNTPNQLESAIQQANSGVLSLHAELIFNSLFKNNAELGLYGETGLTYNRPEPIDITNRQVKLYKNIDTTYVLAGDYFDKNTLENFKVLSTRSFPLGYGEIGLTFKFIKNKKMLGYMCFGYGTSPNILRVARTQYVGTEEKLDPQILEYSVLQRDYNTYFRPKLGLKVGNLVEIKAEALFPFTEEGIDRNSRQNIFRILITKEFPIKN